MSGGIVASPGKTVRSTVLLPERVHRQVQALASANDVSAAWVVRQAVVHYLSGRAGQAELPLGSERPE
jgi:predicted transcriptional regulator